MGDKPPRLRDQPRPFFAQILEMRADMEGGYSRLARAISRAYRANVVDLTSGAYTNVIDRRKLAKLATDDRDIVLSMVELEALNCYLEQFEEGLTRRAFFKHNSIVEELAQSLDATIVIGSRMGFEGPYLSHWDWQAMTHIHRTLNRFSAPITFDLIDVVGGISDKPGVPRARWRKLFEESQASVICIGSQRANRATESAFRLMFRPKQSEKTRWDSLPFYFVFRDDKDDERAGLHSWFSRSPDDLGQSHPEVVAAVRGGKGWGIVVGDRSFVSEAATRRRSSSGPRSLRRRIRSLGVLAAQRQPNHNRLVVVVAGLTGPGTLAAASSLTAMTGSLPEHGHPDADAVLWGVVETVVDTVPMSDGGTPLLESQKFVVEPELWSPGRRCRIG